MVKNDEIRSNSQQLILEDQLIYFMIKCWNFAVYCYKHSNQYRRQDYISNLEISQSFISMAIKLADYTKSNDNKERFQTTLNEIKKLIQSEKATLDTH